MSNEEIFSKNIKIAYKMAWKYRNCGIEFEDLKQICLLGFWKAITTHNKGKSALSTYAYSIIKNEIYMYLRKNKKYQLDKHLFDIVIDNLTLEETLSDTSNVIEDVERRICVDGYMKILKQAPLSIKERRIIELRAKGVKQQEIAKTVGTSQTQVSRIIKKMKKYFKDKI